MRSSSATMSPLSEQGKCCSMLKQGRERAFYVFVPASSSELLQELRRRSLLSFETAEEEE